MSLSFKKFMQFVNLDGEVSDDQINEIFGLFRNNAKVDALKKEREKLKGMSAAKKAELDQALKDFASGKKPKAGSGQFTDWDEVVGGADKTALDREDKAKRKEADNAPKNKTGRNVYESTGVDLQAIVDELKKSARINAAHVSRHERAVEVETKKGDFASFKLYNGKLYAWVQGQKNDIDCGDIGSTARDILDFLSGINKSWYREYDEHFNEGLNEGKVNVKAFKVEIPPGITDSAIWDFIEDQSVVTIEDFERKGKVVYFYPHFDHDYDPHMAGAMQAAFNRFAKQEGLTEAKYFDVPLDNDSDSDRAWEHAMETIRSDEQYHGKIHTDDVYHICKDAADAADLSEHDFNELRGAVEVYLKKERRLIG